MATIDVKVPDIGDFKDVAVIELLVKPGDTVKTEQSLITVESDKASMEIPSSAAGVVKELKLKLGDTVNEGDLILTLEGDAAVAPAAPALVAESAHAPAAAPTLAADAATPASPPSPAVTANKGSRMRPWRGQQRPGSLGNTTRLHKKLNIPSTRKSLLRGPICNPSNVSVRLLLLCAYDSQCVIPFAVKTFSAILFTFSTSPSS